MFGGRSFSLPTGGLALTPAFSLGRDFAASQTPPVLALASRCVGLFSDLTALLAVCPAAEATYAAAGGGRLATSLTRLVGPPSLQALLFWLWALSPDC